MKIFKLFRKKKIVVAASEADTKEPVFNYADTCRFIDQCDPLMLQSFWHKYYDINEENPSDPMNGERKRVMEYIDEKLCEHLGLPYRG